MGVDVLHMGAAFKDGEIALDRTDALANPFVGGQAAVITGDGARLAKVADEEDVAGVFSRDSTTLLEGNVQVDDSPQAGTDLATIIAGAAKLLFDGSDGDGTNPFLFPGTSAWAMPAKIFVDAAGLWDDDGGIAYGQVVKPPVSATDTLEVYWNIPGNTL